MTDKGPSDYTEDAKDQIARLRAQVESLMRDRVEPALAGAADRADRAFGAVREQADSLSSRVRDQPLTSLLVAAGVGAIIGLVFFRRRTH
ncbi:MAG: DUF883 family protein [Proteobacteria bacterium]|nr:DUF883 family protein [Pseudomonadota bacterium]